MAIDAFIKFEPRGLEGESVVEGFKGQIDVLGWNWGASNTGTMHIATGGGSGKANVQDLTFTHYIDKATPNLMLFCCNGKHFDKAVLTLRKTGQKPVKYLEITLDKVLVSSIAMGSHRTVAGAEGVAGLGLNQLSEVERLVETVTLNFGKVHFSYYPQDDKGSAGSAVTTTYDVTQVSTK